MPRAETYVAQLKDMKPSGLLRRLSLKDGGLLTTKTARSQRSGSVAVQASRSGVRMTRMSLPGEEGQKDDEKTDTDSGGHFIPRRPSRTRAAVTQQTKSRLDEEADKV